jgi:hypothetical protein
MELFWTRGAASVREIQEAFPKNEERTTRMSLRGSSALPAQLLSSAAHDPPVKLISQV